MSCNEFLTESLSRTLLLAHSSPHPLSLSVSMMMIYQMDLWPRITTRLGAGWSLGNQAQLKPIV